MNGHSRVKEQTTNIKALGTRENKDVNIEGRVQLDMMQVIIRDHKLRSYSLNSVAFHFLGEQKEDVPWSFSCPDEADQELNHTAAWQIAQRTLETIQEQPLAIEKEEQLAQGLSVDKSGRKHLLNTRQEFKERFAN